MAKVPFGDNHHELLLRNGWTWDGTIYEKTFTKVDWNGEGLRLSPHLVSDEIDRQRAARWDLLIHVRDPHEGEYFWIKVCDHQNFIYAAAAVTGKF